MTYTEACRAGLGGSGFSVVTLTVGRIVLEGSEALGLSPESLAFFSTSAMLIRGRF